MELEHIACSFEVKEAKASGDIGTIIGLGSHFNNVDHGADVILPGAFDKSLKAKMPAMLWQHDHSQIPGKWTAAKEVEDGLELKGDLALKTQLGSDVHVLSSMGAVTGLSIGFVIPPGGAEYQEDGIRTIKEVDLWEVSIVTFPMNELARVQSVKARLASGGIVTKREFEAFLRDAGFSRNQSKAVCAEGWNGIDPDREDLKSIAEAIETLSGVLNHGN